MPNKISAAEMSRLTKPFNISVKIKKEKFHYPRKDIIIFSKLFTKCNHYVWVIRYKDKYLYALYENYNCIFANWKKNLFLYDFKKFLIKNHRKF
jgi:hypothetical protein